MAWCWLNSLEYEWYAGSSSLTTDDTAETVTAAVSPSGWQPGSDPAGEHPDALVLGGSGPKVMTSPFKVGGIFGKRRVFALLDDEQVGIKSLQRRPLPAQGPIAVPSQNLDAAVTHWLRLPSCPGHLCPPFHLILFCHPQK